MAFDNLNVPKLLLYNVLMNKLLLRKDAKTISNHVFESICQNLSVNIKYTERIRNQIQNQVHGFISKIRKSHKGTNAKKKFLKSIQTSTWSFKVLMSEFDAHALRAQVATLKSEKEILKTKLDKKSKKYEKTKAKLEKEKNKRQQRREFQKKKWLDTYLQK